MTDKYPDWTPEEKALRMESWYEALSPQARAQFDEMMRLQCQPWWKRFYLRLFRRYTK